MRGDMDSTRMPSLHVPRDRVNMVHTPAPVPNAARVSMVARCHGMLRMMFSRVIVWTVVQLQGGREVGGGRFRVQRRGQPVELREAAM